MALIYVNHLNDNAIQFPIYAVHIVNVITKLIDTIVMYYTMSIDVIPTPPRCQKNGGGGAPWPPPHLSRGGPLCLIYAGYGDKELFRFLSIR